MDRELFIQAVKEQVPTKRWAHIEGVIETSAMLARQYGADPVKADLAALFHDYTKFWPADKMKQIITEQGLPEELLDYDIQLWHAPVGAYVVSNEFAIKDQQILDAVRYHTSGREKMTLLDKVVCLADYMEPGRDFPGVDRIRELAMQSLEAALVAGFDSTIQFLISKRKKIFPLTLLARNSLLDEIKRS